MDGLYWKKLFGGTPILGKLHIKMALFVFFPSSCFQLGEL
jgi:hypothetical protein